MTENQVEFDNINNPPAAENHANNQNDSLQGLIKFLSCLPCFPAYVEKPETPNINEISQVFDRFRKNEKNETDTTVVDRVNSTELCKWSETVLKYLPSVDDSKKTSGHNISTHFQTMKNFYAAVHNAGYEPSEELQVLFNSMQIYECVMALAFVVFQDNPETLDAINEQLSKAISEIQGFNTNGCLAIALCSAAILSRYNSILGLIDTALGKFGIVKVAEFVANIIEVFCRFFNVNPKDFDNIQAISESIEEIVNKIANGLRSIFGDDIPKCERKSKWGSLAITDRIKSKLSKFEDRAPIVSRSITSFEKLFSAIEKIDDNFEMLKTSKREQRALQSSSYDSEGDAQKSESAPLLAQEVASKDEVNYEDIKSIGKLFQKLETIFSYGVLLFKNEDQLLEPLLVLIDECTRILDKFNVLHPLYKIILGKNYLSKLKVVVKQIVTLLENSNLKLNSPSSFLKEFNKNYPNLLYVICESFVNDKIKQKIEILPDPIEKLINNALDNTLSKFKNKFKF